MGMNSKKPYLHHYSRKVTVPYLLDQDETLLQMQLFDYLSGFAAKDKVNVYVCPDDAKRSEIQKSLRQFREDIT